MWADYLLSVTSPSSMLAVGLMLNPDTLSPLLAGERWRFLQPFLLSQESSKVIYMPHRQHTHSFITEGTARLEGHYRTLVLPRTVEF